MTRYKYNPIDLGGPAFRLLLLLKGNPTYKLQCELFEAWIHRSENNIPYEALSYTWESTATTSEITINGCTMGVTRNLHLALQNLHYKDMDRILWVDAVCINQEDKKVQGHQVKYMGKAYKAAEQVVVWIGPATVETDFVMNAMKRLQEMIMRVEGDWRRSAELWMNGLDSGGADVRRTQGDGLRQLLDRPWFRRIWVIQEIASARVATIVYGKRSISARVFALMPSILHVEPDSHCEAVLDVMPGPSRKESWWASKRDLHTLLLQFRASKATDPRDMIYALLGISTNASNSEVLDADYHKNEYEVVRVTITFLLDSKNVESASFDFVRWTVAKFLQNLHRLGSSILEAILEQDAIQGYEHIVKLLLDKGANVNMQGWYYGDALCAASAGGYEQIVKLLLDKGANVNMQGGYYGNALEAASSRGYGSIVQLLIDNGADVMAIYLWD